MSTRKASTTMRICRNGLRVATQFRKSDMRAFHIRPLRLLRRTRQHSGVKRGSAAGHGSRTPLTVSLVRRPGAVDERELLVRWRAVDPVAHAFEEGGRSDSTWHQVRCVE